MKLRRLSNWTGWFRLAALALAAAVFWAVVLPRAANLPSISARQRGLEEAGVDPSARLHRDHPCIERVLGDLREARRRSGRSLWIPSALDQAH
jgi:hypothetical protein